MAPWCSHSADLCCAAARSPGWAWRRHRLSRPQMALDHRLCRTSCRLQLRTAPSPAENPGGTRAAGSPPAVAVSGPAAVVTGAAAHPKVHAAARAAAVMAAGTATAAAVTAAAEETAADAATATVTVVTAPATVPDSVRRGDGAGPLHPALSARPARRPAPAPLPEIRAFPRHHWPRYAHSDRSFRS